MRRTCWKCFLPLVRSYTDEKQQWHADGFRDSSVRWDQRNDATGAAVSAGLYIFRLTLIPESGAPAQYSDQLVVIRP